MGNTANAVHENDIQEGAAEMDRLDDTMDLSDGDDQDEDMNRLDQHQDKIDQENRWRNQRVPNPSEFEKPRLSRVKSRAPWRNYPPVSGQRHFSEDGGGCVYFEAPRGRNFIRPPFLYAPHP